MLNLNSIFCIVSVNVSRKERKKNGRNFSKYFYCTINKLYIFSLFFYKNMTNSFLVRIKLSLPIFILRDEINKGTRWRPPINHIAIYIYRNRAKMYKLCFFFLSMKIFAGVILLFDELYSFEQIREFDQSQVFRWLYKLS